MPDSRNKEVLLSCIAVDDEPRALEVIRIHAGKTPFLDLQHTFRDPVEALSWLKNNPVDLIFLDINMPDVSGLSFRELAGRQLRIVFTSAYSEYAVESYDQDAVDYLVKPIDPERLSAAVEKLPEQEPGEGPTRETLHEGDQIFLKDGEKCWFVTLKDVRLFQSEGNYVRVLFDDQKPLVLRSLNTLEKKLDPLVFFRVSRKHIVNLRWVEKIEPWFNGGLMVKLKSMI